MLKWLVYLSIRLCPVLCLVLHTQSKPVCQHEIVFGQIWTYSDKSNSTHLLDEEDHLYISVWHDARLYWHTSLGVSGTSVSSIKAFSTLWRIVLGSWKVVASIQTVRQRLCPCFLIDGRARPFDLTKIMKREDVGTYRQVHLGQLPE